jgi:hypothetical protein
VVSSASKLDPAEIIEITNSIKAHGTSLSTAYSKASRLARRALLDPISTVKVSPPSDSTASENEIGSPQHEVREEAGESDSPTVPSPKVVSCRPTEEDRLSIKYDLLRNEIIFVRKENAIFKDMVNLRENEKNAREKEMIEMINVRDNEKKAREKEMIEMMNLRDEEINSLQHRLQSVLQKLFE